MYGQRARSRLPLRDVVENFLAACSFHRSEALLDLILACKFSSAIVSRWIGYGIGQRNIEWIKDRQKGLAPRSKTVRPVGAINGERLILYGAYTAGAESSCINSSCTCPVVLCSNSPGDFGGESSVILAVIAPQTDLGTIRYIVHEKKCHHIRPNIGAVGVAWLVARKIGIRQHVAAIRTDRRRCVIAVVSA